MIDAAPSRHHRTTAAIIVTVGAIALVLWWFQPQKLVLDRGVNERPPASTTEVIAAGDLRPLAHAASGRAVLLQLADGSRVLRFEDLAVENGPDLRVYLSGASADARISKLVDEFVDLGVLKGNEGDQNYRVSPDRDPSDHRSVVIWCRRFRVGFAVAPL